MPLKEQLDFDLSEPLEKVCSGCKVSWPLTIYHNSAGAKDGKQHLCTSCRLVANQKMIKTRRAKQQATRELVVYFIHQVSTYWWKIGKATNVKDRRANLQCGNPQELKLIDHDKGDRHVEHEWHKIFARRRGRGEWFYFGPEEYIIQEATSLTPIVIWEPERT